MKKSILILGISGSGKTTKMNEILSTQNTMFFKDEVVSCEEIENVHSAALKANSFLYRGNAVRFKRAFRKCFVGL